MTRLFNGDWKKLRVVEVAQEENRGLEGHHIAGLSSAAGADPLDYMLDLACSEQLRTLFLLRDFA